MTPTRSTHTVVYGHSCSLTTLTRTSRPPTTHAHRYAFPYQPYAGAPSLRTSLLADHFAHQSAMRDFNEVMPVLVLPTAFTPGLARSIDRGGPSSSAAALASSSSSASHSSKSPSPLLDLEGDEWSGGGGGAMGRRLGARDGVEAVGGRGSQQQQPNGNGNGNGKRRDSDNENTPRWNGGGRGEEGEGGREGEAAAAPPPLLGKDEALTLEKLPWRL